MDKKLKIILIGITMLCLTSLTVSAASLIKSSDVVYDNSKSGIESTTVQGAVDELYSAATDYSSLETRVTNIENNTMKDVIDKIYPVGSIYMSTTEDTVEKVQTRFGGEWERYSQGRTLIGVGTGTDSKGIVKVFQNNSTGGLYNHNHTTPLGWSFTNGMGTVFYTEYLISEEYNNVRFVAYTPLSDTVDDRVVAYRTSSDEVITPYVTVYMYKRKK